MIAEFFIFIMSIIKRVAIIGRPEGRMTGRVSPVESPQNHAFIENEPNTSRGNSCEAECSDEEGLDSRADGNDKEKEPGCSKASDANTEVDGSDKEKVSEPGCSEDIRSPTPQSDSDSDSDAQADESEKEKVCEPGCSEDSDSEAESKTSEVEKETDPEPETVSSIERDITLVCKAVPIGKCITVGPSESDIIEKCTSKGKTPKKGILITVRCKTLLPSSPIGLACAEGTVKVKKSVTFSLPDESEKHSTGSKSLKKKKKGRASSVGFKVSSQGRLEAKTFWAKIPLIKREYYSHELNVTGRKGWDMLFDDIVMDSDSDLQLYCDARNQDRNRCRDILPYDHTRVKLTDPENNYINASLVRMEEVSRCYIITQGPMDNTITHFWQMVWEQQSVGIVMLCQFVENEKDTSAAYWPMIDEDPIIAGCYMVECISSDWEESYCISSLKLCNTETEETRTVLHFHYFAWPDVGVPENPLGFLEFLMKVRDSGVMQPDVGPAVVHCSAGVDRSGVFAVSDACMSWVEEAKGLKTLDVKTVLLKMREQRPGLIQTIDQLRFTYITVLNGAHHALELAPSIDALEYRVTKFRESLVKREMRRLEQKCTDATREQPAEDSVATVPCSPQISSPASLSTPQLLETSSKSTPQKTPSPTVVNPSTPPPAPCSSSTTVEDATPPNTPPGSPSTTVTLGSSSTAVDATPPNTPPGSPSTTVTLGSSSTATDATPPNTPPGSPSTTVTLGSSSTAVDATPPNTPPGSPSTTVTLGSSSTVVDAIPPNTPPGSPTISQTSPVDTQPSANTLSRSVTVQDLTSIISSLTDILELPEELEIASVGAKKETKRRKKRCWFKKLKKTLFQCTRGVRE